MSQIAMALELAGSDARADAVRDIAAAAAGRASKSDRVQAVARWARVSDRTVYRWTTRWPDVAQAIG